MRWVAIIGLAALGVGTAAASDAPVYRIGGEWETSFEVEFDGMDEESRAVVERQMAESLKTERICEPDLTVDSYPKAGDPFEGENRSNCHYDAVEAYGEPVRRQATCDVAFGEPLTLSMAGWLSPEAYEITASSATDGITVRITERGKLIGPC